METRNKEGRKRELAMMGFKLVFPDRKRIFHTHGIKDDYKSPNDGQWNYIKSVDIVCSPMTLNKSEVFRTLGKYDEKFFSQLEDVDFCHTLRDNNFAVVYNGLLEFVHNCEENELGSLNKELYLYYAKKWRGRKDGE